MTFFELFVLIFGSFAVCAYLDRVEIIRAMNPELKRLLSFRMRA